MAKSPTQSLPHTAAIPAQRPTLLLLLLLLLFFALRLQHICYS
jgi:hypothetical protein